MRAKVIISLLLFCIIFNSNICFAMQSYDIWDIGQQFIGIGLKENNNDVTINSSAKEQLKTLLDFLWGIGLLTIFISSVILGIKYMFVSPNEKSKVKQALTPYIIGVVIIFGAVTIWRVLLNVLEGSL